jgi:hypothetical protein
MAFQDGKFGFTGRVGVLSGYRMRGLDGTIVRTRGGATKKKIRTLASFEPTRNLNSEWRAVTKTAKEIRQGLEALRPLADYNISGPLNALVKKIQSADSLNPKGKRSILFSRYPDFLSGFSSNKQTLFESVVRQSPAVTIDPSSAIAEITVPALQPAVNFFPHPRYAYYRVVLTLTAVSDYSFNEKSGNYEAVRGALPGFIPVYTEWAHAKGRLPETAYRLSPRDQPFETGPGMILLYGIGIQDGMPEADGSIQPAPRAGAARILKGV